MTNIQKQLFSLQEKDYGDFQYRLNPTLQRKEIIGVRVPKIRQIAKQLLKENPKQVDAFLDKLPHKYYEENMLHSILITSKRDFDITVQLIEKFCQYIDNWAVCDTISPKVFVKNTDKLMPHIKKWISSKHEFTCRLGIKLLNDFYLSDNTFDKKYVEMVAKINSDQYYVKMMIAWFMATALDKQWENSKYIIEKNYLPDWEHNKSIQKAKESRRIPQERKDYLNSLKRVKK